MQNKSLKIGSVVILTLVCMGLLIFMVYYLIDNKDVNKVTTDLKPSISHANQIDQVPIKDLNIKVTLDTLPATNDVLTSLDFKEFTNLFKTSKRSILVITKTGCSYCEDFIPKLKSTLSKLGISAYELNKSNLKKNENLGDYVVITGTPITLIIENGNIVHSFSGSTDEETIEAFLDLYYLR